MDARWAMWWALTLSVTATSTVAAQRRPERCEDLARGDGYVVVFREAAARFDMPSRPALDGEELILCIDSADRWNRYRLTFGRSQQGTTSVGFAPTQALTTALRRDSDTIDATLDCDTLPARGPYRAQCAALRTELHQVLSVQRNVTVQRDALAQMLVDLAARPLDDDALAALDSLPDAVCLQDDGSPSLQTPRREGGRYRAFEPCTTRLPLEGAINLLLPDTLHWNDGQWHFLSPRPDARGDAPAPAPVPPAAPAAPTRPAVTYTLADLDAAQHDGDVARVRIEAMERERQRLLAVLADSMRGYAELTVIAQQIVTDARRRALVFRLGRFGGNTLVAATLERYGTGLAFDPTRARLTYDAPSTTYALSIRVNSTSFFQAQLGVIASMMPTRAISLVNDGMMPGLQRIQIAEDHYFAAAAFVNIFWCAQDLSVWFYGRRCVDGADWRRFVPSVAVGVPLGKELFDLNVFAGLSLPYIPYASIILGVHLGRVPRLLDVYASSRYTALTDVNVLTSMAIEAAPFAALTLNSDILDALRSPARSAQ